jgi:hypothetical protein
MQNKINKDINEQDFFDNFLNPFRNKLNERTISNIIKDAILKYNETDPIKSELRKRAVDRFCSKPFDLRISELKALLNEDYYNV